MGGKGQNTDDGSHSYWRVRVLKWLDSCSFDGVNVVRFRMSGV